MARTYVMVNPSLPQLNNGSPHPRGKRKTLGTRLNQVRRQFKAPPEVSPLGSKKRANDAIQLGPYRYCVVLVYRGLGTPEVKIASF